MDLILNFFQLILLIELVHARGSMLEPPQRSSLWRFRPWKKDKSIPKNLEDYGLNCGGFWRLHGVNKGECGVCGDPYDAVSRQNEAGGKYANGIIVKRYRQHRKYINVTIDITANIGGHFEFRLCPNNNVSKVVTQDCLNKHRLTIEGHGLKFKPKTDKKYKLALEMPKNITCSQCVLQWKWRGSYNWGRCDDGYQDVGCGNQEEYYNCADIAILPSRRRRPMKKPKPDNWSKIIKKEDKVLTISPSKDVKTMSKDINDIKSIDKLLIQKTNQVDPTNSGGAINPLVSGIPVYIYKSDASTTLPPINIALVPTKVPVDKERTGIDTKPPPIFVGNTLDDSNVIISKPNSENFRKDTNIKTGNGNVKTGNAIFDLASTNIMNGVKQDLVQSPGNNIFNKAQWIKGTTRAPGIGLINASGEGQASVQGQVSGEGQASILLDQSADTNTSLTNLLNNTALNASAGEMGILDATEDATLDPFIINRNIKMLSDMFYGAMIAGGETDLEGLLLPFYQTVTQAHPFGDLANQFMESVHALNEQRQINMTKAKHASSNRPVMPDSQSQGIPVYTQPPVTLSSISTIETGAPGTSAVISDVSKTTTGQHTQFSNVNFQTATKAPENTVISPIEARTTKSSTDSSKQQTRSGETIPPSIVKPSVLFQTETKRNPPTSQQENSVVKPSILFQTSVTIPPLSQTKPSVQFQATIVTNPQSSQQENSVVKPSILFQAASVTNPPQSLTKPSVQFQATSVTNPPSSQQENSVVKASVLFQEGSNKNMPISQQENTFRSFETTTTLNPLHGVLQQMNNLLNNLNSQLDVFVHDANAESTILDVSKTLIGSNPDQSTVPTVNTMADRQNVMRPGTSMNENNRPMFSAFKKDGVVVSDVGGVPVHDGRQIYIEQPAIDIVNQMDTSWRKLSQEPTINRIIKHNNEPATTTATHQKNTPVVISDPKSKFSFQKLTARNVEVNDLVHDSNQLMHKQNSIANEARSGTALFRQQSSDIVNPILGAFTSGKREKVLGRPINDYQKNVMLPELLKQVNNLDKLAKQKNLDVVDLWDAAHKILSLNSTITQRTGGIIVPMQPTSSNKDVTVLNLGQNIASKNKRASYLTDASNVPKKMLTSKTEKQLNVLDHVLNKKTSPGMDINDMHSWLSSGSNFLNNGIFVIPTSPGTSQTMTTPATINTGVTASMLDLMSSIWNPQQNLLGNVII